ncbi:MAG: hypothetical protein H0X01_10750, partial [Nitrospira sp.]|nr:hypothetical protein [Nitrospira sp.]
MAAAAAQRAYDKPAQRAQGIHPWAFAAMARDCMLYSNELRSKPVDARAMQQMQNYFFNSPAWDEAHGSSTSIFTMLLGMAYEQTWYQRNVRHELARSFLLFTKTQTVPEHDHPNEHDWEELLGVPFLTAMAASFALFALTCSHLGTFDPEWPGKPDYSQLEEVIPANHLRRVLDLLTTTVQEAQERAKATVQLPAGLQRYAFNPLIERPFVDLGDGLRYAPQPQFALRAFETGNLYYRGMQRWGKCFGSAFGARVEAYTGMQLRHTGEHTVIPEFTWNKKRAGLMRSSDWLLVTPAATVLIECKSARMSLEARAGTEAAERLIEQYIGKAYRQLENNASEITAGNTAFSHIPADRRLVGLIVTAEPMIGANSVQTRKRFGTGLLPVLTASLADIELLSSLSPDNLGEVLL